MKLKDSSWLTLTLTVSFLGSTLFSATESRTVGIQTLGDYTHESQQEVEDGPITHIFTGPKGFNQTLVTGPEVNQVESLSDPLGVTFTISSVDGTKRHTIGPLKSEQFKISVSQVRVSSNRESDSEAYEITAPYPRVFEPCFPFCKDDILFLRRPTGPRQRPQGVIEVDRAPAPTVPPPRTFVKAPIKATTTTEVPPEINILKKCFPFCGKN